MLCTTFAFIDGLGAPEMGLIFIIVLVLFGGQKLPEFARGLGKSIREFKKAAAGVEDEFKRALEEDERKHTPPALPEPAPIPPNPAAGDPAGPDSSSEYYDYDGSDRTASETEAGTTAVPAPVTETTTTPTPVAESSPLAESTPGANEPAAPHDLPAVPPPPPPPDGGPERPAPPSAGNQPTP